MDKTKNIIKEIIKSVVNEDRFSLLPPRFNDASGVDNLFDAIRYYRDAVELIVVYNKDFSITSQKDISKLHDYFSNKFGVSRSVFAAKAYYNTKKDFYNTLVDDGGDSVNLIIDKNGGLFIEGEAVDYWFVEDEEDQIWNKHRSNRNVNDNDYREFLMNKNVTNEPLKRVLKQLNKNISDVNFYERGSYHETWIHPVIKITDNDLVTLKQYGWKVKYSENEQVSKFINNLKS